MTTLVPTADVLSESRQLIATIERLREELPFADNILAIHRPTHQELESTQARSAQSVTAWREALAQRWDAEVAGRRIYKRIIRQIAEHYGSSAAPEVQALTRGEAEANSSPAELLADLRRLQAAFSIGTEALRCAREHLPELTHACATLDAAIAEASRCETQRRNAALDSRIASEAYRRARAETRRLLAEYYGEHMTSRLDGLLK